MIREEHLHSACCDLVAKTVLATGSAKLKVIGLSMLPAIWPGDVLTVRQIAPELIEPGQVVLYRSNGKLTAHRVVQVARDHFLTRGDCVPSLDPPAPFIAFIGRVVSIERNGRAAKLLLSPWQRTAAWFLQHSELSMWLLLHFRSAWRHFAEISEEQIL